MSDPREKPFTICPVDGSECRVTATIGKIFSNNLDGYIVDEENPASVFIKTPTMRIRVAETLGQLAEDGSKKCTLGAKIEEDHFLPGTLYTCQMPDIELIDDVAKSFGIDLRTAYKLVVQE